MKFVTVGKVVNTHNIKGEVRLLASPLVNETEIIQANEFYIDDKKFTKESIRKHKSFLLIKFTEFNSINDVLWMKNKSLSIVLKNNHNSYLWIKGYKVVDLNNQELGIVKDVSINKFQKLILLNTQVLIPWVDAWVEINEDKKVIYVKQEL